MQVKKPCSLNNTWQIFKANINHLRSSFFNFIFILDEKGGAWRGKILYLSFLGIWLLLGAQLLKGTNWYEELSQSFRHILSASKDIPTSLVVFTKTLLKAFFAPSVLRLLPIFLTPFLLALKTAHKYLADIYELENESIAAKFMWQAAFGSEYEEIKIEEGKVSEESKNSPIIHIGGPGRVKVDLYSAALFEKPNGRPHVIGPTFKPKKKVRKLEKLLNYITNALTKKKGGVVIEGFERIRGINAVIDLRDQTIDPIEVSARTLEGIKISAKDVRMVYSIWRGHPSKEEAEKIYPYSKQAIPHFFYQNIAPDLPAMPMIGKIKGELSAFIANHSLSEFLTSAGEPEKDSLKERAATLQKEREKIIKSKENAPPSGEKFKTPDFSSRDDVNRLFSEFTEEFSINNRQKGVDLYWLGTGTWVPPDNKIPEKNLEAWQLSKENAKNGTQGKLNATEIKEKHDEIMRLIRKVPLDVARVISAPNSYKEKIIQETLKNYMSLIKDASNILETYTEEYPDLSSSFFTETLKNTFPAHWLSPNDDNQPVG
ncbi:MAG: hypothetical protein GY755_10125 [Chloroflexi bacterium]|nr:hypothetical protein [Chloroflexota bacterium]